MAILGGRRGGTGGKGNGEGHSSLEKHPSVSRRRQISGHKGGEGEEGEGNWLVSYADMMTLLVGFFVMITAFSTPDSGKIEKLRKATAEKMGGKYVMPLQDLTENLKKVLEEEHLEHGMAVENTGEAAMILVKGALFFDSASAEIRSDMVPVVSRLARVLRRDAQGFRIIIEGHTDDVPISTPAYPSNWELSSARAGTVVRLFESFGVPHSDLRPVGFADTQPAFPNRTPAGEPIEMNRAKNRRILIRIQKY